MITIIGGSIAGLFLGVKLSQEKIPVEINESGQFPRHRICPEIIDQNGLDLLQGVVDVEGLTPGPKIRRAIWFYRNKPVVKKKLKQACMGISRYLLDKKLADKFEETGGILRTLEGVAGYFERERQILACRQSDPDSLWVGLKGYAYGFRRSPLGDVEIHFGDEGFAMVVPLDAECSNVFFVFRATGKNSGKLHEIMLTEMEQRGMQSLQTRLELSWLEPATFCLARGISETENPAFNEGKQFNIGKGSILHPPVTANHLTAQIERANMAASILSQYHKGTTDWAESVIRVNKMLDRKHPHHERSSLLSRGFTDEEQQKKFLRQMKSFSLRRTDWF